MLFENSVNRIMITTHPIQWRSMVLLTDFFLYPVWKMLSQYWIKKADSLGSVCSSPCSTWALPFPVHVEQVCAVARVWEGSVPLALCVWGWQLSKDRPADPSEVMFVGALSCPAFAVTGTGTKGDGDAAAVTPACLSAECAHKSSTELELTMPDCISRGAVEFTRWITAAAERPVHYSAHFWCVGIPRFVATVKSKAIYPCRF